MRCLKGLIAVVVVVLAGVLMAGPVWGDVNCATTACMILLDVNDNVNANGCGAAPGCQIFATVDGNVRARNAHVTVRSGGTVLGNIEQQRTEGVTVDSGGTVEGNIKEEGLGDVDVTVGAGGAFNGDIQESGGQGVTVIVNSLHEFNGNVEESGAGSVMVTINGTFNGNIYEKNGGSLTVIGAGTLNGNTKEENAGGCTTTVAMHNGNPCE